MRDNSSNTMILPLSCVVIFIVIVTSLYVAISVRVSAFFEHASPTMGCLFEQQKTKLNKRKAQSTTLVTSI